MVFRKFWQIVVPKQWLHFSFLIQTNFPQLELLPSCCPSFVGFDLAQNSCTSSNSPLYISGSALQSKSIQNSLASGTQVQNVGPPMGLSSYWDFQDPQSENSSRNPISWWALPWCLPWHLLMVPRNGMEEAGGWGDARKSPPGFILCLAGSADLQ